MAAGTFHHHLGTLTRAGAVRTVQCGRRRLIYPATGTDWPMHSEGVSIIHGTVARRVAERIEQSPGVTNQRLAEAVQVSARAAYYHVHRMHRAGLVAFIDERHRRALHPTGRLRVALAIVRGSRDSHPWRSRPRSVVTPQFPREGDDESARPRDRLPTTGWPASGRTASDRVARHE